MLIVLKERYAPEPATTQKVFMKISNLLPRFEILMERTAH